MKQGDPQPHAAKTSDQLLVLDEWVQHQIHALVREREMIQAEMRRRSGSRPLAFAAATIPPVAALSYRTASLPPPMESGIGDSYADHARRYALRLSLVLLAILIVGTALCCMAAML